jgi:hypothetical protein
VEHETHEIAYVDLPPISAQPKARANGKLRSAKHFQRLEVNYLKKVPLDAPLYCAPNGPIQGATKPKYEYFLNCVILYNIHAKLSLTTK